MSNSKFDRINNKVEFDISSSINNERIEPADPVPMKKFAVQKKQLRLHVVFLVDTTGSMQTYLTALKQTLLQISALLNVLFPSSADLSVFAYKDYSDGSRLLQRIVQGTYSNLRDFCSKLVAFGGGDLAEASKTALNSLSKCIKAWKDDFTVVFHYTDAPPHHHLTNPATMNRPKEEKALCNLKPGYDWCRIAKRFRRASNNVKIFTIVPEDSPGGRCGAAFYALLGELVALPRISSSCITQTTMKILLELLGEASDHVESQNECAEPIQRVTFQKEDDVMEMLLDDIHTEDTFPELNTDACKEPTWKDTVKNTADLVWTDLSGYSAIPAISNEVPNLRQHFKVNSAFRDAVFESMKDLVLPEHVMALTAHDIFGRMWRLVCTRRDDDRLNTLVEAMGRCVASTQLSDEERSKLKAWLENSYDYSDEINEKITHHQTCTSFYVMDAFVKDILPDVDALRSLGRSPTPSALSSVQNILSHIIFVEKHSTCSLPVDNEGNCQYLPASFDDYELFTMLPHIIQAGSQFSLKPAAILAILCCRNKDSLLEERARRFLISIRGKWLPPVHRIDRPEIISYEFSSLIATCPVEGALTEEEHQFFHRLHEIWRYRRARLQNFDVVTPIGPSKPMLLPDFKAACIQCKEWTSLTLMDRNKICGICLWTRQSPKTNKWARPNYGHTHFESFMVECCTCHVMYAVLGPEDLKVAPKCHYCRGLDKDRGRKFGGPYRRCRLCRGKWCDPSIIQNDESNEYVCPVCTSSVDTSPGTLIPAASITTHSVSLNEIIKQNPLWVTRLGFRKNAATTLFSSEKIYKIVVNYRKALFDAPLVNVVVPTLHHKGRAVLNTEKLLDAVVTKIKTCTFVDTCQLCFDELALERLKPACGHCTNRCCAECLTGWYKSNKPGKLFIPSHDMCPFCRKRPQYKVLSQYNKEACAIVGLSRRHGAPLRLRSDWYYGWCTQCWRVGYAMARTCAQGNVPELSDFVCEECEEKNQIRRLAELENEHLTEALIADGTPCPGCQMVTFHLGGCSHMTCANCNIHWCWQCSFSASTGRKIYDHMKADHGSYGWI